MFNVLGVGSNFANFDEAFSGHNNDNENFGIENLDFSNTPKFTEDGSNGFANFDSGCIKPIEPSAFKSHATNGPSSGGGLGSRGSGEDRYAALKDLDEIFKHGKFQIYFVILKYYAFVTIIV